LTKVFYPGLDLHSLDERSAQKLLINKYIDNYGPVTLRDICWWSALPVGRVTQIIKEEPDRIAQVRMTGFEQTFYVFDTTVRQIREEKFPVDDWITLLAHEDPSLKGYFESRRRYVDDKFYSLLFNRIGEARASIVNNGRVIGIWSWNKKRDQIEHTLFRKLDKSNLKLLSLERERFNDCLKNRS